jgi:hypothetical protein
MMAEKARRDRRTRRADHVDRPLPAGLSQHELAWRLGTTQKYVWQLEAGKPSILIDRRLIAAMRGYAASLRLPPGPDRSRHKLPRR